MSKISIPGVGKVTLVEILMDSALIYAAYRWISKHTNTPAIGPELPGIEILLFNKKREDGSTLVTFLR